MSQNFDAKAHHQAVNQFLEEAQRKDPERVKAVSEKYPTLGQNRWRAIKRRERTVGLLGAQPTAIHPSVANAYDYESVYIDEEN